MIDLNLDEVLKSLADVEKTFVRKLNHMFNGFFYEIGQIAVGNTPYGDSVGFEDMYKARSSTFFGRMLPSHAGLARNAWRFSAPIGAGNVNNANYLFTSPSSSVMGGWEAGPESGSLSLTRIQMQLEDFDVRNSGYIVIYNTAPYITKNKAYFPKGRDWSGAKGGLEQGHSSQSPNGILKPTVDNVASIYRASAKFKQLFDQG
jgi:hypothetical protein